VKTARNVVLKRLSATAERYIICLILYSCSQLWKIREVYIRTTLISRLQEKIRRTGLTVRCQVDIHGSAMSLGLNILASKWAIVHCTCTQRTRIDYPHTKYWTSDVYSHTSFLLWVQVQWTTSHLDARIFSPRLIAVPCISTWHLTIHPVLLIFFWRREISVVLIRTILIFHNCEQEYKIKHTI